MLLREDKTCEIIGAYILENYRKIKKKDSLTDLKQIHVKIGDKNI